MAQVEPICMQPAAFSLPTRWESVLSRSTFIQDPFLFPSQAPPLATSRWRGNCQSPAFHPQVRGSRAETAGHNYVISSFSGPSLVPSSQPATVPTADAQPARPPARYACAAPLRLATTHPRSYEITLIFLLRQASFLCVIVHLDFGLSIVGPVHAYTADLQPVRDYDASRFALVERIPTEINDSGGVVRAGFSMDVPVADQSNPWHIL